MKAHVDDPDSLKSKSGRGEALAWLLVTYDPTGSDQTNGDI